MKNPHGHNKSQWKSLRRDQGIDWILAVADFCSVRAFLPGSSMLWQWLKTGRPHALDSGFDPGISAWVEWPEAWGRASSGQDGGGVRLGSRRSRPCTTRQSKSASSTSFLLEGSSRLASSFEPNLHAPGSACRCATDRLAVSLSRESHLRQARRPCGRTSAAPPA